MKNKPKSRCGFVAIIGRPNVGKSTLLNKLLGKKISITSRKPQTTRHRILGIKTIDETQIIYVDTPGIHRSQARAMNRYMNRVAKSTLKGVDIIVFMLEAMQWRPEDAQIAKLLHHVQLPIILLINKIDEIKNKEMLLPYIEEIRQHLPFNAIIPISAKHGIKTDELENEIIARLPYDVHYFPADQLTDRDGQFICAEIIREKLMRHLGEELPYALTVTIDIFENKPKLVRLAALIWVEQLGQKAIVIGKQGSRLKEVATKARLDIEKYFAKKAFLQLWVKVKSDWSDSQQTMRSLGYDEDQ